MTRLRATFDGKVFVPIEPVELPAGSLYQIDVREDESASRPQALLRLLQSLPKLPSKDIDEMEAGIRQAELPSRFEDPFRNGSEG
jgi:hypothetical protein